MSITTPTYRKSAQPARWLALSMVLLLWPDPSRAAVGGGLIAINPSGLQSRAKPPYDLFPTEDDSDVRYFYAVENLDTGDVVARGQSDKLGLKPNSLILSPNGRFRYWLLHGGSGRTGYADFRSGPNGNRFIIPPVPLGLSDSPDSDIDGLSDDAEFILGTNPNSPDTDLDGINDGAALRLGLNPGMGAITGITGTADTPGTAVDVYAFNDLAVIADLDRGISVFNVFNPMTPRIIAQVDTPGTALAVAGAGSLVAVADGSAGLAIVDVSDPPAARIIHQLALGGTAQAVATAGGIGYVSTREGMLFVVDLPTGALLQQLSLGGTVEDLAIERDYLYAFAAGQLKVLPILEGDLTVIGSVGSPGGINSANGRGRMFVGGSIAYLVHTRGYNTFNVSDPAHPTLLNNGITPQFGWKNLVLNGSGLGLGAVSPNQAFDGPHDVSLYNVTNLNASGQFLTLFQTPGIARAVTIFNGFGYVADHSSGLQAINYLAFDAQGRPPTISLSVSFTLSTPTNGVAEEGKFVRVTATVTDDVQVRNVEFYIDSVKVATDGNFPFEHRFVTPALSPQRNSFLLSARVFDTGGNFACSEEILVTLVLDATPPRLVKIVPPDGTVTNSVDNIFAYFNEPLDTNSVNTNNLYVLSAGADNRWGTADDVVLTNGIVSYRDTLNAAVIAFPGSLPLGIYRVAIGQHIRDAAGNEFGTNRLSSFGLLTTGANGDDDGDGVPNSVEIALGTNPFSRDTDGDGWEDGDEIADGTDPTNSNSRPRLTVVARPPLSISLPSPETFGSAGAPVYVARPPVSVDLPNLEGFGTAGAPIFVARPPLSVDHPSAESFGNAGAPTYVAKPPLSIDLPSPEGFGISGAPTFVARPTLEICLPSPEDFGSAGAPLFLARPPLAVDLPSGENFGNVGAPIFIALPPFSIDLPSPETFGSAGAPLFLALPPLRIGITNFP